MEKEDGKTYYEVKMITSNKVLFEVEIDAHTGKIVEVENEGKHSRKKEKSEINFDCISFTMCSCHHGCIVKIGAIGGCF